MPNNIPGPLGYCASCIAGGHRKTATTLVEGTSACDLCTLEAMHIHDDQERVRIQHSLNSQDRGNELGG
jgi:hypothetical protein